MNVTIVGIAGGSGSGKTTLCQQLSDRLGAQCSLVSCDHYYHSADELSTEERAARNFDHPDALELDLLARHLRQLKAGEKVNVPQYCFANHVRLSQATAVDPKPVIIVEGILLYASDVVRDAIDLRIFVDADESIRYQRRLRRDVRERARTPESVRLQWDGSVAPMHAEHVAPTRKFAHLVVNMNEQNEIGHSILQAGIERLSRS